MVVREGRRSHTPRRLYPGADSPLARSATKSSGAGPEEGSVGRVYERIRIGCESTLTTRVGEQPYACAQTAPRPLSGSNQPGGLVASADLPT
jgi:hypothetical protein